ncbi:unnamed protein product [Rotaria sordida]|uniref:Uncharacterized protein n=1 Tax=Rotaria sordida TaxID=392033 RepID=A0A815TYH5_9BILA|nr:unnamed protein product [Rotaria sordida]CAF1659287.1 unnamed protein product [Rotaria sordida]
MCLGHSTLADHLRVIEIDFITKLLKKATYEVSQLTPDFLHYSKLEFCSLERFSFDKAADLQAFHPDNDDGPVQTAPNVPFSLSDDDMKQDNGDDEDEDEEQLKAFVSLPDKIVF